VALANVIAWPVAYWAMSKWLQDFAYRIILDFRIFVLGGLLALVIALAVVSYQTFKAARSNPIDALRCVNKAQSAKSRAQGVRHL
jgi:putative ABC transport system permease protein